MRRLPRFLLAAVVVVTALPVGAVTVNLSPTRLVLTSRATSTSLTLRNESDEPIRFQVKPFAWTNGPGGDMQLAPTDNVVIYPTLFTIDARATRLVRVGIRTRTADRESTYRLILEQLPDRTRSDQSAGLMMLTNLNLPLFIEPTVRQAKATLLPPSLQGGRARTSIVNEGSVHLTPTRYALLAQGANEASVWKQDLATVHLLAGEHREQAIELPEDLCAKTRYLVAEIEFEQLPGQPLRERVPIGTESCRR